MTSTRPGVVADENDGGNGDDDAADADASFAGDDSKMCCCAILMTGIAMETAMSIGIIMIVQITMIVIMVMVMEMVAGMLILSDNMDDRGRIMVKEAVMTMLTHTISAIVLMPKTTIITTMMTPYDYVTSPYVD